MDFPNPKTILVVQIGKIGDMILTTPLFIHLKNLYPDANLTVLAVKSNSDIPLNHKSVDKVITYEKNISGNINLIKQLRSKIDFWVDTKPEFSKTSAFLRKLLNPRLSMGFNFDKKIFDISLNQYTKGKHAVDINLSPVNYLKGSLNNTCEIPWYNIPDRISRKFSGRYDGKIVFNISAGDKSRYPDISLWSGIIESIAGSHKDCLMIGLRKDSDLIKEIKSLCRNQFEIYFTESIIETSEIVRKSKIVISPDTSVVHICSAFNKPVIAMYPEVKWNLERFAPLSDLSEAIISRDPNSLKGIEIKSVTDAFERISGKLDSGNAESRTRVRKEDH